MGFWAKTWKILDGVKPVMVIVVVEIFLALGNVMYKLATNDGMNSYILFAYRTMFAAAFIIPVAFFAERKKRPRFTRKIASYGFLCGLLGGTLGVNLFLRSMILTSATFSAAMTNLIPTVAFVVTISLRVQQLNWDAISGKAKVLGAIIGIGGALLMTFYKGPDINVWDTNISLLNVTSTSHGHHSSLGQHHSHGSFIKGATLGLISCLCYSFWLLVQAKATELYPCPYTIHAIMTLSASFQGVLFALCVERDWSKWRMGWNIRLWTVVVTGIWMAGVMFTWMAWCVRVRGPHFVAKFHPLMPLLVAICESLFLEQRLHLGIVIGAILIVSGQYMVLWGSFKELNASNSRPTLEDIENQGQINTPALAPPPPRPQHGVAGDG